MIRNWDAGTGLGLAVLACAGTPWARATKNVKKPPGEKGQTFRK